MDHQTDITPAMLQARERFRDLVVWMWEQVSFMDIRGRSPRWQTEWLFLNKALGRMASIRVVEGQFPFDVGDARRLLREDRRDDDRPYPAKSVDQIQGDSRAMLKDFHYLLEWIRGQLEMIPVTRGRSWNFERKALIELAIEQALTEIGEQMEAETPDPSRLRFSTAVDLPREFPPGPAPSGISQD